MATCTSSQRPTQYQTYPNNHQNYSSPPRCFSWNIPKWIPRLSREQAGSKLASILEDVVNRNDHLIQDHLLWFSRQCCQVPPKRDKHLSLVFIVHRHSGKEANICISTTTSLTFGCLNHGAWLKPLPITSLGLKMDNNII